ncbi:MAG: site-specific integrase [Blautia sp.]|nr:site-specific integrase [Blautia sp.]
MAGKNRKDHRGRVLPPNVSQKSDQRYIWRKMIDGHQYVLTDNDLNELKKKIVQKESELQNGIYSNPTKITLNEWFYKWMDLYKGNLKLTTKSGYLKQWKYYVQDSPLGKMQLSKIKRIHIIELYKELSEEKELATTTVHGIHIIIYGALSDAMEDGLISENPAMNAFSKIKHKEPRHRQALSVSEQERFIDFVSGNNIYKVHLPMFAFFLGTGARFGEMAGLTWKDIDLQRNVISINHNMQYLRINGKMTFHVSTPKTKSGIREIPILPELKKQLLRQKQYDFTSGIRGTATIDGYTDFVFHTATGNPYTEPGVNAIITRIVNAYNDRETDQAVKEKREPELLPDFSPHILRHTFCTRFCENESNVKVIQAVMGHGDIKTTMNIYAHATEDKVQETMQELSSKIKIC